MVADLGGDDVVGSFGAELREAAGEESFGAAIAVDVCVVPVVHTGVDADLDAGKYVVLVDVGPADGLAVGGREVGASHRPAATH